MGRIKVCNFGRILLKIFCWTTVILSIYLILGFTGCYEKWFGGPAGIAKAPVYWLIRAGIVILAESIIFWIGIIMVYVTSEQLGIRWRVLGIVCGWIPVAHLVMLHIIVKTVGEEVRMEKMRAKRNLQRKAQRIHQIVRETGCEKVNVIAHSKGGLDMRAAIAHTDIAPYVASLTTINTPHRGCQFADYLLGKIPEKQQQMVANTYNAGAAKLGDINPDFLAAVYDLTSEKCSEFNNEIKDNPDIYYQSVGSKLNHPASGRFPLNFTYPLVKYFDGPNDGLVGEESFRWGQNYQFLTVRGKRGISHGDMIDLNRENIKGFDVREFYVQVVAGLKKMGF